MHNILHYLDFKCVTNLVSICDENSLPILLLAAIIPVDLEIYKLGALQLLIGFPEKLYLSSFFISQIAICNMCLLFFMFYSLFKFIQTYLNHFILMTRV